MKSKKLLFLAALASLSIMFSACEKENDDDDDTNTPSCTNGIQDGTETGIDCGGTCNACVPAITETYYFKGNVDGDSVIYQSSAYESGGGSSGGAGGCELDLAGVITESGAISGPLNAFELRFDRVYTGPCPAVNDTAIYYNLFATGSYDYTNGGGPNNSQIEISYVVNSVSYSTSEHGAQPASSTIQIVENTPIASFQGEDAVKLKVRFNCKLKASNGDVLDVTNGETVIAIYDFD